MQKVLVADDTGYLGGFVAKEFKQHGHFVRALARTPHKLDCMKDKFDEDASFGSCPGQATRLETGRESSM